MVTFKGKKRIDIWRSKNLVSKKEKDYKVAVYQGKPIDILSLKSGTIEDFKTRILYYKSTRTKLFTANKLKKIDYCPVCRSSVSDSRYCLNIYNGRYHQCMNCGHCFIINRPTKTVIDNFYQSNTNYSSTYTDRKVAKTRVQQVAAPKVKWMVEQFQSLYGKKPKRVLDVGAGGGHFVYSCKEMGIDADGLELSESSRSFCKKNFGFNLYNRDFVRDCSCFSDIDIITFWGLIEHVADPMSFLHAAYKVLKGRDALIIAEVPRWDCLGTTIQLLFPNSVIRHLDPLGHINCFTDNSIATAFEISGFAPTAAWYFGMDIYELIKQISLLFEENTVIDILGKYIVSIQNTIDRAQLSDEIVLAGKPEVR